MKIGFIFQKDSHLKAVQATALRLSRQYGIMTPFYALNTNLENEHLITIGAKKLTFDNIDELQMYDYLICCLGGCLLNQVIGYFANSNIKIIALFPGIVSHYQLDAFISRFNADQVWLNCHADYELYAKLCQVFGVKNNGILYGAAWFFDDRYCNTYQKFNSPITIFFEQTQVILNATMAQKIERQLLGIIQNNPKKTFIYKMRQNIYNEYLVQIRQNVAKFDNVMMIDNLTNENICCADIYLSISSSAIMEGLLLNKQAFLLSQSYLDRDAQEIFANSGLFLDKSSQKVNIDWVAQRISAPMQQMDLMSVTKTSLVYFSERYLAKILLWLLYIMCYYPKMWRLIVQKNKLKTIQKSLEYLSYDETKIINTR